MNTENEFTLEKALAMQADDLKHWESVLKPKAFAAVQREARRRNKLDRRPDDVWRGDDIERFVNNLALSSVYL